MSLKSISTGEIYTDKNITIFFGNKSAQASKTETETEIFNSTELGFAKQTHSNTLLKYTKDKTPECDGLYTNKANVSLRIQTADCLPVFTYNDEHIFAVHAGWRGLASGILYKLKKFNFNSDHKVLIGPHIKTYEVGQEVIDQIKESHNHLPENYYEPKENNKYHLKLDLLARLQLETLGFQDNQIITSTTDTLTNPNWHSYRRDAQTAGRNYSFITKTK